MLARVNSMTRQIILLGFSAIATATWAQQPQSGSGLPENPQSSQVLSQSAARDYSKPRSQFPNVLAPYKPEVVPQPNLHNTARIDGLIKDGRILLSMDDAVALAIENNLDVVLSRHNLNIADTDILRAKAGSNILG